MLEFAEMNTVNKMTDVFNSILTKKTIHKGVQKRKPRRPFGRRSFLMYQE